MPTSQSSIFERLSEPKKQSNAPSFPPKRSVLKRLEKTEKPSRRKETTPKKQKPDSLAEKDDIQSSILSRMKRQTLLEIDENGPLKVRRRTIIHTGQSSQQQAQKAGTEGEVQNVFHITIQEDKESEAPEEDVAAAPPQLEDGGQATVDDL